MYVMSHDVPVLLARQLQVFLSTSTCANYISDLLF